MFYVMVCGPGGGGVSRERTVGSAVPHREPTLAYSLPVGEQLTVSPLSLFHKGRDSHTNARGPLLHSTAMPNVDRYNRDHSYLE